MNEQKEKLYREVFDAMLKINRGNGMPEERAVAAATRHAHDATKERKAGPSDAPKRRKGGKKKR